MNHTRAGIISGSRRRARLLAMGLGAVALLSAVPGLRAAVILQSRLPDPDTVRVTMTIGGPTDATHQQIAIGLTMGSISMRFDSMTAWIDNNSAESIALVGGIYTDLGGNPGAFQGSFVPVNVPPGADLLGASLLTSAPITLAANTTYWFLLDGAPSGHTLGWLVPRLPDDPLAPSEDYEPVATPPVTFVSERVSEDSGATWRHLALTHVAFSINATASPVPEPSTWALGAVALGVGAIVLRRRRIVG